MSDTVIVALVTGVCAITTALITGLVALKVGDTALKAKDATLDEFKQQAETVKLSNQETLKAKDATIEQLKQQNEVLKATSYKEARDQLLAARALFDEAKAELSVEIAELRKQYADLSEKWRQLGAYAAAIQEARAEQKSASGAKVGGPGFFDKLVKGFRKRGVPIPILDEEVALSELSSTAFESSPERL
jgi:hypothetical protein